MRGASSLATRLGIAPLVIGLVIVSASTSAPEFAVTYGAVAAGNPDLALGNVVGSNIVNILFILGLAAVILPLVVKRQLVRFDIPVMVGITVLLLLVSLDGTISRFDGVLLFAAAALHVVMSFWFSKRDPELVATVDTPPTTSRLSPVAQVVVAIVLIAVGIGLLVGGASLLVEGASNVAAGFGVSDLVIGLTVVAVGTSLPELVTSIVAVFRGERDIAVGNIVGSNIFNIGTVLGVPAIIFAGGIPVADAAISLDIPLALAAAVALLPIAFTGFAIARWEGGLFVVLYGAYTTYLILASVDHAALTGFTSVMLFFVLPLVAITLIAAASHEVGYLRAKRHAQLNSSASDTS